MVETLCTYHGHKCKGITLNSADVSCKNCESLGILDIITTAYKGMGWGGGESLMVKGMP